MDNATIIEGTATPVRELNLLGVLQIPAVRQVMLLLGVAAAVATGFAVVLWSQTSGYTQLYGDLGGADAAEVTEALRAADIKFKLNAETGNVMVPERSLHQARLELASAGLPAGTSAGMNLMQEQSSFGVSQFMEGARYQYALEAELATTIAHLGAVREARVHLAMPKQSAFIRDQKSASASVLLQLFRSRQLEPDQAAAIVNLVASSVPNLVAKNVTLIDQHGRLLSSGAEQWQDSQTVNQFKHTRKLEETYKQRIEELLIPLVGPGRVRAQVVAQLDFTMTEETREFFDPASTVVRSEQISEEQRRNDRGVAAGVPGALSNQPPAEATTAATDAEGSVVESESVDSSRRSTRNFEVDRTISRIRPQSGTIERLSVAVLVDDSPMDGIEDSAQQALTDVDLERYTSLVKEAVGFDEVRGDTVVVLSEAFRSLPELPPAEEPPFWKQPLMQDIMKQAGGVVLVLILAFGLVRPMLRGLVANHAGSPTQYVAGGSSGAVVASGVQRLGEGGAALAAPSFDEKVAAAKNITGHDPARVAQVVKQWVTVND